MNSLLRQKVIQANSPKLLAEEVARFAVDGWRKTGEPTELVSAEIGRATYWVQTLDLVSEAAQLSPLNPRH